MNDQLDPQAVALTKAIRQTESGGNFNARSKDGSFGAYQFLKPTWDNTARKYGVNASWERATPSQQNEVAYKQIKEWKDKGHNVGEIASMWNAGAGRPQAYLQGVQGTNSSGVNYNVANYAKKVATLYQGYKGQYQPQVEQPVQPIEPTIQEQKSQLQSQGQATSVRTDRAQPTVAGSIVRGIVKPFVSVATTVVPVARGVGDLFDKGGIKSKEEIYRPVKTNYLGDVYSPGAKGIIQLDKAKNVGDVLESSTRATADITGKMGEVVSYAVGAGEVNAARKTLPAILGATKVGAKIGAGGGLAVGLQEAAEADTFGKALGAIAKNTAMGGVAGGVLGGAATGVARGISKIRGVANAGDDIRVNKIIQQREKDLNKFDKYQSIAKLNENARQRGMNPKALVAKSDVLVGSVDDTGTITTLGEGGAREQYYKGIVEPIESVVSDNLKREGSSIPMDIVYAKLKQKIDDAGLTGGAKLRAYRALADDIEGYGLDAVDGKLSVDFIHRAKVDKYGNINFMNPESKKVDKAIAEGLKELIEENTTSIDVKEINKELAQHFQALKFIEALNNKKVEGGKLGKYFYQTIGAIVGAKLGPLGPIVGAEIGGKIKGAQFTKTFGKATGNKIEQSARMKGAIDLAKQPRLGLPAPKVGSPKSSNYIPIELGGASSIEKGVPQNNLGNLKTTQSTSKIQPIGVKDKPKAIPKRAMEIQAVDDIPTQLPKSKVKSSDLSTGVKKAFNDAKDTLKTLKDKNVRERGSISLESILPESKSVGNQGVSLTKNTTEDLIQQAKKYKSAEEFVKAKTEGKFGNIKKIDITLQQEKAFISDFSDKFLTQKSQASGLTYSTLDKMGSLNTALKQKGFKGVSNSADFKGIYSLDKVIDNSALFEKYPDLKKVNVIFADFHTPTQKGVHIGNDIFLNSKLYAKDTTNIESTLVHEIEHAIQDIEGKIPKYSQFEQGRGMTPDEYVKDARENGARAKQQDYINHIQTKSQLIDIWNKANKKILPKNTKLIKNKDGSITYGSQKMSGDFKGMPDIEIIKMFDNTPF